MFLSVLPYNIHNIVLSVSSCVCDDVTTATVAILTSREDGGW